VKVVFDRNYEAVPAGRGVTIKVYLYTVTDLVLTNPLCNGQPYFPAFLCFSAPVVGYFDESPASGEIELATESFINADQNHVSKDDRRGRLPRP
jgi:hypothetical protein